MSVLGTSLPSPASSLPSAPYFLPSCSPRLRSLSTPLDLLLPLTMSSPLSRLSTLASHFVPSSASPTAADAPPTPTGRTHIHQLSPIFFLPRAAEIEPSAPAVHHTNTHNQVIERTYAETADRARGLAYYLRKHGYKRVGILCPNTPAFLESIFGIGAAAAVNVAINYRLEPEDLAYIFEHAEVDSVIVDAEFAGLLELFKTRHPNVPMIVDVDGDGMEGPYDRAVAEGSAFDAQQTGLKGWDALETQVADEDSMIALAYTSGTTAKPKGVEYTHRSCYLAALGNVIESNLNTHNPDADRCHYLWTLPMFHAMGWTFPWSVTAVRGTHYTLRKIDYPSIWHLLREKSISHFNAAPTVNTLLCASPSAKALPHPVRVTVAASPPSAHLFQTMEALNLHPVHVYGLTETYGPITKGYHLPAWKELPINEAYAKKARQGHGFIASLPARVVKTAQDDAGSWTPVHPMADVAKDGQEIGEIVFRGNLCARGYYKDAEATRKLFEGGVLHSGDLAIWHDDGSIQILDRAKDVIISGGENISSVALEGMLVRHPDVLEAACVGVSDERWGEVPRAYVTVKEGKGGGALRGEDVRSWAKKEGGVSGFMVPREVLVVEELPKTSTGKVRKNILREWAKEGR